MKHKAISVRQLCALAKRSMMNTDKETVTGGNTLTRRIAAQLGGKWRAYYREANTQRKDRIGREITALNNKLAYEKARIAQRV